MNKAAGLDDPYWLEKALEHGGDPNVLNLGNRSFPRCGPLHYAVFKRQTRNVEILIDAGADVNHRNGHGISVLMAAAESGDYRSVVVLLESGADPLTADNHGNTVVDWISGRDEGLVLIPMQRQWFRRAKDILAKQGLVPRDQDSINGETL